ncbi:MULTISPECIES: aromatic amino acid transport family protein [unclassified Chromobacterium]|uniref:aromatic amino acid transport family protein n=1 Tax=unclassified Chromobacterium TaxID=2641838 RepID=UPI0006549C40|nr:aromatic amino acid transport family protein [Chromobacterium sp. LK1]KMN35937.1 tyrosine transporter [Chromobacterium sp. LK1]
MQVNFKAIGATLLISGTMLGAGMLALPLVSAGMGFGYACLTLFLIWMLMTYTGLMLLEVCLSFPEGYGFDAIAKALFDTKGSYLINASLLLLLYALSSAYISGGGSTYKSNLHQYLGLSLSPALVSLAFTLLIGGIVFVSTNAVDKVNRLLFSLNVLIFLALSTVIQPYVDTGNLSESSDSAKYMLAAIPMFLTAFGFHGSVPSMVKYLGRDQPRTLRNVFIAGSLIPMGIYLLWVFNTLGALPRYGSHSFQAISSHNGSVGMFLDEFHALVPTPQVPSLLSAFSSIALFTSYLCVSLGLFDAMASTLKRSDDTRQRLQTALITYLPPLGFALFFPSGFVAALGAAAIFLVILAILFPALALIKLRRQEDYQPSYQVSGGGTLHWAIGGAGIAIILFQLLVMQGLLPVF